MESWARTAADLLTAAGFLEDQSLTAVREYLAHNELQLAADTLVDIGDEHGQLPSAFWEALRRAYENMGLERGCLLCSFRIYESEHGFVEARLTLLLASGGGRSNPISTGYQPDWDLSSGTNLSILDLSGAPISLEDCQSIAPGGSGTVRLHPIRQEAWRHLRARAEINMHEGARVIGKAIVLRVMLRQEPPPPSRSPS